MAEDSLRTEARALRELLEEGGMEFRPIELKADAPARVKIFWETLGWSDALADMLVEPTYQVGRARARKRLEGWLEDKLAKLTLGDLPDRFRVVEDDGQGVGFLIVDETVARAEPRHEAL